jgi:ankyrin repeat protein
MQEGISCLCWAIREEHSPIVKMLLDAGARWDSVPEVSFVLVKNCKNFLNYVTSNTQNQEGIDQFIMQVFDSAESECATLELVRTVINSDVPVDIPATCAANMLQVVSIMVDLVVFALAVSLPMIRK